MKTDFFLLILFLFLFVLILLFLSLIFSASIYFSASGAWNPDKCPPSTSSPPYSSEDWNPTDAGTKCQLEMSFQYLNDFNTKLSGIVI